MNYQFVRDLNGSPIAQFEMGSETFSRWFSEELGVDTQKIEALMAAIVNLQNREIKEYVMKGSDISIFLDIDEVEVRSNDLDFAAPEELPEGTELYDQESMSGCGLDDFARVIESWRDFV